MKKQRYISFLLSIMLVAFFIGFMWLISPLAMFGVLAMNDNLNPNPVAKVDIEKEMNNLYGDSVQVINYSKTGKNRSDILVAYLEEKNTKETFSIYYDLKSGMVLFDEYEQEMDIRNQKPTDFNTDWNKKREKGTKKDTLKHIAIQDKSVWVLERILEDKKQEGNYAHVKRLEERLEKEYENYGYLLNVVNSL